MKTELFCSVFKKITSSTSLHNFSCIFVVNVLLLFLFVLCGWLIVNKLLLSYLSFLPVHITTPYPLSKRFYTLNAHAQMNSTNAHFNISAREIGAKLNPYGSVCQPFWIVTVEWSGARSCLFWWPHRFQIASFSSFTPENSGFKKHRFQIAPLWRAFSNGSVFGDRYRRCSEDDSRIRSCFRLKMD